MWWFFPPLADTSWPGGPGAGNGAGGVSFFCWSGQGPGAVSMGEAVLGEGAQVECGASGAQPGVVLSDAEVAQLDAPPVLGGGPGDDPLDVRAGGVGLLELRGAGLGAGGAQQVLMRVDGHRPAIGGGGAAGPQRAAGADLAEGHRPGGAHLPGVPGGAGDGADVLIDVEVVEGEPTLDGRSQRLGLDHGVVSTGTVGGAGRSGAIGGVAVDL